MEIAVDALRLFGALLLLAGAGFALLAAIGLLRLPDLLLRMHAGSKSGTFGAGLALLAVAPWFGDGVIATKALAAVAFLMLTVPVAGHLLGRAAYLSGVPLWSGTVRDEWAKERGRE